MLDHRGRIVTLKLRRFGEGPRYVYLSDPDNPCGTHFHWARAEGSPPGRVTVTEGELKADYCAAIMGRTAVSVPGVSNWKGLPGLLKTEGFSEAVVAMDWPDLKSKGGVREQVVALVAALKTESLRVGLVTWEGPHKGVDDAHHAHATLECYWDEEVNRILEALSPPVLRSVCVPASDPAVWEPCTDPVPFPVDVYPKPVEDYLRRVAESLNDCPVDFPGFAALAAAASAIGASRRATIKEGWYEPPVIFGTVIAPPGSSKSPAFRSVLGPMRELQRESIRRYEKELEAVGDDLKARKALRCRRYYSSNFTVEALVDRLSDNPRGLLISSDELMGWYRSLDQYRPGNDRQFFLSMWSSEEWPVDRKGGERQLTFLRSPYLSLVGTIQPQMLAEIRAGSDDGLGDRILLCQPEERGLPDWTDAEVEPALYAPWRQAVRRLYEIPMPDDLPVDIGFSPDGRAEYVRWHDASAAQSRLRGFPRYLLGFWRKATAYVKRFALTLEYLHWSLTASISEPVAIGPESVAGAARLMDYFKAHFQRAVCATCVSPERRQVEDLIRWVWTRRSSPGMATARELVRSSNPNLPTSIQEARRLFILASQYGLGEFEAGAGRDRDVFTADPSTHGLALTGGGL